jgi:hypothetical protein
MGDWLDDLSEEDRQGWDEFVDHFRRDALEKMTQSAFIASIVPKDAFDVKFATELGAAIMLDKPLLGIVMPGVSISAKLRSVFDEIVEADIDTLDGQMAVGEAVQRMAGS